MEIQGLETAEAPMSVSAEIEQQRQMKIMLEVSIQELQKTATEMERRLGLVEEEGCEWRTRYETQQELNERLRLQLEEMRTKVKEGRDTLRERLNFMQGYNQQSKQSLKQRLWKKEEERQSLQEMLLDYEWRIAQEAKAYHKVINEKREVLIQLGEALDISTRQKKLQPATGPYNHELSKRKAHQLTKQQQPASEPQQGPTRRGPQGDQLPKLGKFQTSVLL